MEKPAQSPAWGLGYCEISMLKSMLVDKDFQNWNLLGLEAMLENPC